MENNKDISGVVTKIDRETGDLTQEYELARDIDILENNLGIPKQNKLVNSANQSINGEYVEFAPIFREGTTLQIATEHLSVLEARENINLLDQYDHSQTHPNQTYENEYDKKDSLDSLLEKADLQLDTSDKPLSNEKDLEL